jgi:hypothetical protein
MKNLDSGLQHQRHRLNFESSAIGAYGTSKVAPEQLEREMAQSLNDLYQEIAQMTWEV